MVPFMESAVIRSLSRGVNQSGVRDYNERLLLTLLQRNGPMAGSELARLSDLSPQTISIILREMEAEGLLARGAPVKGKVGKPSVPMSLAEDGVLSFGCKIGRRSAVLLLADFRGTVRHELQMTYKYPLPEPILGFLREGIDTILAQCRAEMRKRVCGIGIGMPFELWRWNEQVGASISEFQSWKDVDLAVELGRFTDLPVHVVNDATAGCQAEHIYGRGKEFRDYAYFFVGAFIGGGIVLNHSVYQGHQGNAGALGSLRSFGPQGESQQLIDTASIHLLETRLSENGHDPQDLWTLPQDWSRFARFVEPWLGRTAQELARASLSVCAVIDFEAILIDGAFPPAVKHDLVERTRRYLVNQDMRGLIAPRVEAGAVGGNARAIGAAASPLFERYFMNGSIRL
ncbi:MULTISPECIES: ROK family transcriptional regulator [unclassified Devosia]|uniref:ROK family transcriptional regulator n=1 Tax=unclassified Devosia TaxID=196773 RepID=UPI000B16B97B|nr:MULTISPECIES: ROK family transcriptional regulator [unclassified Devosia]MBN9304783.1 ROK family transcriptional regulator [Devosia sp.]